MPDPIPVNRNVIQGQQQTQQRQVVPSATPVRPASMRRAAARPVANPVTPQPPLNPRVTRQIPTPPPVPPLTYGEQRTATQPIPRINSGWGTPTQPTPRPVRTNPPQPVPQRVRTNPPVQRQAYVPQTRRNGSDLGRGVRRMLVFAAVFMVAVWGATFAFPSLLQYGIIADIAQFVSNIFYTIGILAMMIYAHRDAILSFVVANPLLSACVSIIVLLCIVLLWKSIYSGR